MSLPPEIAKIAARLTFYERSVITASICADHINDYHKKHPILVKLGITFPIRKWQRLFLLASDVVLKGPQPEDNIEED